MRAMVSDGSTRAAITRRWARPNAKVFGRGSRSGGPRVRSRTNWWWGAQHVASDVMATFKVLNAKPARELVEAVQKLLEARLAGADTEEVNAEIDAIEWAMARWSGIAEKVCSVCGATFAPKHQHLDDVQWVDPANG